MSATEQHSVVGAPVANTPWPGFKYKPVERYSLPSRKLMRKARKNMRAILAARAGNHEIAALLVRMEHIKRSSRAGFHQKLRYFLEVERDYIAIVTRAQTAAAGKTGDQQAEGSDSVGVQPAGEPAAGVRGEGADDGGGVPGLATQDGGEPIA